MAKAKKIWVVATARGQVPSDRSFRNVGDPPFQIDEPKDRARFPKWCRRLTDEEVAALSQNELDGADKADPADEIAALTQERDDLTGKLSEAEGLAAKQADEIAALKADLAKASGPQAKPPTKPPSALDKPSDK